MKNELVIPCYDLMVPKAVKSGLPDRCDVAVVGGGIVGLSAGLELAQRGLSVFILDDDNTVGVCGLATRGICYSRYTLRIFDQLGVMGRLNSDGVTWRVGHVLRNHETLYSFELPSGEQYKHPPFINVPQFIIEEELVKGIYKEPSASLRWGNKVIAVEQDQASVRLTAETAEGTYEVHADYVIACDGAHSDMRGLLTESSPTPSHGDWWLIIDFWMSSDWPLERLVWIENEHNDGKAVWFHPLGEGLWRIDCQIGSEQQAREMAKPEEAMNLVKAILAPWADGREIDCEAAWVGPWCYRTFVTEKFRVGNVFFAGDAAHIKPPFGARGGNSGVMDTNNLCWKLADVINGVADSTLLDTYEMERRQAAEDNVHVAGLSSRFLVPRTEMESKLRQAALTLSTSFPGAHSLVNSGRLSVANQYRHSSGLTQSQWQPSQGPIVGEILVDARVTQGGVTEHLLERIGQKWLLLIHANVTTELHLEMLSELVSKLDQQRMALWLITDRSNLPAFITERVLLDNDGDIKANYAEQAVYLVRPDGYVAWCGQFDPQVNSAASVMAHFQACSDGASIDSVLVDRAPDLDDFYAALGGAYVGMDEAECENFNMELVLLLATQISDHKLLFDAVNKLRETRAQSSEVAHKMIPPGNIHHVA